MQAMIALIPERPWPARAYLDSDGVVNEPLTIALTVTRDRHSLIFDFAGSSPPCAGPMNSVRATTLSSVYLAMRHIFPEVPISAGAFDPLHVTGIENTFLDARYPRPVSGCAAEVSQRIAEAVFAALVPALPDRVTAAPAGTSGNFALGGHDPERGRDFVIYQISGGGYGGNADHDGLANGCSTIGISKAPPVEIMEQQYPVLYRRYALHEGSGGAGTHRGGFGLDYEVELLRGTARASFVMDHGRFGPQGALGGGDGGVNRVEVIRDGETLVPRASLQGPGHPPRPRRPRPRPHPRRRRLRRPARPRPRRRRRGRPPRPLHRRAGRAAVRPVRRLTPAGDPAPQHSRGKAPDLVKA